jgi:acyl-CoA thioester hydrolase
MDQKKRGNRMRSNEFQLTVEFGHTDAAGIVFYPNYFMWFDQATHWLFRSMQLPPKELQSKLNIILPLLDAQCTFEKPLLYDDLITIQSTIVEVNRKTFKVQHEIFKDGIRACLGYEIRGWVKKEESHIATVMIPENIREILTTNKMVENAEELLSGK